MMKINIICYSMKVYVTVETDAWKKELINEDFEEKKNQDWSQVYMFLRIVTLCKNVICLN